MGGAFATARRLCTAGAQAAVARLRSPEGKAAVCAREGDSSREAASCRCRGAECARAALLLPVVVAAVHAERRVAIDAVRLGSVWRSESGSGSGSGSGLGPGRGRPPSPTCRPSRRARHAWHMQCSACSWACGVHVVHVHVAGVGAGACFRASARGSSLRTRHERRPARRQRRSGSACVINASRRGCHANRHELTEPVRTAAAHWFASVASSSRCPSVRSRGTVRPSNTPILAAAGSSSPSHGVCLSSPHRCRSVVIA